MFFTGTGRRTNVRYVQCTQIYFTSDRRSSEFHELKVTNFVLFFFFCNHTPFSHANRERFLRLGRAPPPSLVRFERRRLDFVERFFGHFSAEGLTAADDPCSPHKDTADNDNAPTRRFEPLRRPRSVLRKRSAPVTVIVTETKRNVIYIRPTYAYIHSPRTTTATGAISYDRRVAEIPVGRFAFRLGVGLKYSRVIITIIAEPMTRAAVRRLFLYIFFFFCTRRPFRHKCICTIHVLYQTRSEPTVRFRYYIAGFQSIGHVRNEVLFENCCPEPHDNNAIKMGRQAQCL